MMYRTLTIATLLLLFVAADGPANQTEYSVRKLGQRTYVIVTAEGNTGKIGSNSGFVVLDDGIVVIDTHNSVEAEEKILSAISKVSPKPIKQVINTHGHWDHAGGNSAYPKNVPILSHSGAIADIKELKNPRLPNERIHRARTLFRGTGDEIRIYAVGEAHSDGDLAVYVKRDRVLFYGDLYVNGYVGYMAEGYLKEWVRALKRLGELSIRTAVPGHGPLSTQSGAVDYQEYLSDFIKTARDHFEKEGSPNGYQLPAKYDDLRARNYIDSNVKRAFELWKKGDL